MSFFNTSPISYEGPSSKNPLAFRYYNPDQKVAGKTMRDHLRFAICYWHSFCWEGGDPFGGRTFQRPWFDGSNPLQLAEQKAEAAFELFSILGAPYYCFHDRDIAPEGATPQESKKNLWHIAEVLKKHMDRTGIKLLWGTANAFSNRRYMAGAASNPNPDIFAFAAAQVKEAMDVTRYLNGENYVLWGGREGYETLLNTNLKQELDQLGRLMNLVVDYKHKTGFKGLILIEPKPREPSTHQYDFDVSTVYGFLKAYGLENEIKVNIEANHATLAGHSFEHEIAMANALGLFGSIDFNRGDTTLGWDTDQFPNNVPELTLAMYRILQAGGFTSGGLNFDAKVRRQSLDPQDLLFAHIGGMDCAARALLAAQQMIEEGVLDQAVAQRYAGWKEDMPQKMLKGEMSLEQISEAVLTKNEDVAPTSGRQEYLENLVNRYC